MFSGWRVKMLLRTPKTWGDHSVVWVLRVSFMSKMQPQDLLGIEGPQLREPRRQGQPCAGRLPRPLPLGSLLLPFPGAGSTKIRCQK